MSDHHTDPFCTGFSISIIEEADSDHETRIRALEATIERMDADRKIFIRHVATLGRDLRRALNDNKALRLGRIRRERSQGLAPSPMGSKR